MEFTKGRDRMTCPNCGALLRKKSGVCKQCGTSIGGVTPPSKWLPTIILILAVALTVVAAATAITGYLTATNQHSVVKPPSKPQPTAGKQAPAYELPYSVYAENGELLLLDTETAMPYPITTALHYSPDGGTLVDVVFSKDGSHMFYAENVQSDYDNDSGRVRRSFSLYYCATEQIDAEPKKLADDVSDFVVSEAGTAVMYVDTDGTLYRHDLTEKIRVGDLKTEYGDGRANAYLSKNGQTVVYINDADRLYIKKGDTDALLVDENVGWFYSNDAAFGVIYYAKSGDTAGFYKKKDGYETEKLVSGDANTLIPAASGTFYMLVTGEPVSLYDLMEDDLPLDMPDEPTLPVREDFETDEAYAQAMTVYTEQAAAVAEAERLAILRARLRSETFSADVLWYFDGKKMVQVSDWVSNVSSDVVSGKLVYSRADQTTAEKPKLSLVQEAADILKELESTTPVEWYAATEGKPKAFDSGIHYPMYSEDGSTLVYTTPAADGTHTVYRAIMLGEKTSSTEQIGTAVSAKLDGQLLNDGTCLWLDGEILYENGEQVAEHVQTVIDVDDKTVSFLYFTNWDDKDACGTLMLYTVGGEAVRIADDVCDAELRANGAVVFLADYDAQRGTGTLRLFKDDEIVDISDQVSDLADSATCCEQLHSLSYAQLHIG